MQKNALNHGDSVMNPNIRVLTANIFNGPWKQKNNCPTFVLRFRTCGTRQKTSTVNASVPAGAMQNVVREQLETSVKLTPVLCPKGLEDDCEFILLRQCCTCDDIRCNTTYARSISVTRHLPGIIIYHDLANGAT